MTNWIANHIGNKIKELRKEAGYSQQHFAEMISLSRASVMNIESGRHSTTMEKLYIICSIFKCTPNDIFPKIKAAKLESKTISRVLVKKRLKYKPVKYIK